MSLQISYEIQFLNGNKIHSKLKTTIGEDLILIKKRIYQIQNIKNQHSFQVLVINNNHQTISINMHINQSNFMKQLIFKMKEEKESRPGSVLTVRSRKMSDQSQWEQESLLVESNLADNFIQQTPQIPPVVCGYLKFPNFLFFCFSTRKYLVLDSQQAKFYEQKQEINLYKSIKIDEIHQIKSYKRKHFYCIRLILISNQTINMKFINKDICREWVGYFNQVLNFNYFLKEKKEFSGNQSYQKYVQTFLNSKNKSNSHLSSTRIINISDDEQKTIQSVHNDHISCESSFKKIHNTIIRLSSFFITHKIDSGSFSTIYLAEKYNKKIVLKQMNKDKLLYKGQMKYAITQLNCLIKSKPCPYIIPLYYAFQTHQYLYLALKYIPYGNLGRLIKMKKKIGQEQAIILLAELAIAIEFLHDKKILYRDLKPENILLDKDGHLYLTDFGLSIELNEDQQAMSFLGTPLYLAPERFTGENNGIDYKSDIYAVGMIFFEMLHGYHPFFADNFNSVVYNIRNTEIESELDPKLSSNSKSFLIQTLQKNPSKRLSKITDHPIFYNLNMKKIHLKEHKGIGIQLQIQKQKIQITYEIDCDYNERNYPDKKIMKWNYNHEEDSMANH